MHPAVPKVEAERLDDVRDSDGTPRMTPDEKLLLAKVDEAFAVATAKVASIQASIQAKLSDMRPNVKEEFEFEFPTAGLGIGIRADNDDDDNDSSIHTYYSYGISGSPPELPGGYRCMNLYGYDESNHTFLVWFRNWIHDGDGQEIIDELLWVTRDKLPNNNWLVLADREKDETLQHLAQFGSSLTSFDKYSYAASLMEKSIAAMKRSDVRSLVCKECDKKKLSVKACRKRKSRREVIIR